MFRCSPIEMPDRGTHTSRAPPRRAAFSHSGVCGCRSDFFSSICETSAWLRGSAPPSKKRVLMNWRCLTYGGTVPSVLFSPVWSPWLRGSNRLNHVCCGLNAPHAAAELFSAQTVFDQWIKSLEWSHQVASLQSKHTSGETFLPANLSGQTKFITIYWHIPFQRMNAKTLVGMNKNKTRTC